jgi:hypothetical protein
VLADSAFPVAGRMFNKIITPLKDGELEKTPVELVPALLIMSAAITSMRQSAEWGMGAVGKVYRQLNNHLPFDQEVRGRRLSNMFRLYNFRVRRTGISQIRNYFYEN